VRQSRSARTRDRILETLDRALLDGSLERLTVHDIVEQAGCSVGAFYGRFSDKDAAIAGLYRKRRDDFLIRLAAASEQARDLDDWARRAVALAFDHAIANRPLLARAAIRDHAMATIYADARVAHLELVDQITALLTDRFKLALAPGEASSAAAFALAMIGAMSRDAAVYSADLLGPEKTRAWFIDQAAHAVAAYLRKA
jgi:TetR/AcrR family transcriptional repressor of nem operon